VSEGSPGAADPDATLAGDDADHEPAPARADDHPAHIGHFAVLRVLGRGAMGTVYSAFDESLDRRVAIKVLHPGRKDATAQLEREAKAMAKLSHPNVGQIYEI
jgi:serine/threonine-protein kinase